MSDLLVEARDEGAVWVIAPRGFVNAHTAPDFEAALRQALGAGRVCIVVDCSGLVYIASAGLGAMMGTIEEIREAGGDLRLSGLNDTVRNIFEILGLHHLYKVFPTTGEAVGSYAPSGSGDGIHSRRQPPDGSGGGAPSGSGDGIHSRRQPPDGSGAGS